LGGISSGEGRNLDYRRRDLKLGNGGWESHPSQRTLRIGYPEDLNTLKVGYV
jgi:hypothetical protein